MFTLLDLCVSPLHWGHANILCTVSSLTDDPRRSRTSRYVVVIALMHVSFAGFNILCRFGACSVYVYVINCVDDIVMSSFDRI